AVVLGEHILGRGCSPGLEHGTRTGGGDADTGADAHHQPHLGVLVVAPHRLDGELGATPYAHEFAETVVHGGAVHRGILAVPSPPGGWRVDLQTDPGPDAGNVACVGHETGSDHGCLIALVPVVVADDAAIQVRLGSGGGQVQGCAG